MSTVDSFQNEALINGEEEFSSPKSRPRWLPLLGIVTLLVCLGVAIGLLSSGNVSPELQKYEIDDPSAVCNDGSPGIYYVRRNTKSSRWLIYVEGGFMYCWDEITCNARQESDPALMTSTLAEDVKKPEGLLSNDCAENPDWCDANLGYIYYCSSDYFSGQATAAETGIGVNFLGWNILQSSLDLMLSEHGMAEASEIFLTGKGGGGVALMFAADRMLAKLEENLDGETVPIKALMDTGWLLTTPAFEEKRNYPCQNYTKNDDCSFVAGVRAGIEVWNPAYSTQCSDLGFTWECYFGEYMFPWTFTDLPVYVFQYQYDAAQLGSDGANLYAPEVSQEVLDFATGSAETLMDDMFAGEVQFGMFPGCLNHEIMDKNELHRVFFESTSFNDAVNAFFYDGQGEVLYDSVFEVDVNPEC